jgi:GNAT superfamily N-acetyltransferase
MFADIAVAARIERAEARLITDLVDTHATVTPVGGGVAVLAKPGSPANKVIGVGFGPAVDEDGLAAIEAAWAERGEGVRFELSTLADPAVGELLTARGYRLKGYENVLGRPLVEEASRPSPISIVEATEHQPWLDVAVDGFAAPDGTGAGGEELSRDALLDVVSDFLHARAVRRYLAIVDGAAAGAASFHADPEARLAQLCGATTLPAFRRRGVQGALLQRRLEDARRAGCELAVITTLPGSQSQANAQRHGFAHLYARAVLIRA